jgi:hypothetical protein
VRTAVDEAKKTVEKVKSTVLDGAPGVLDSELIMKDLQCVKYDMKKLKSREVCTVISSVDPSVLKELGDEIAAVNSAADDAKATVDGAQKKSADATDAASDAQRDTTSAPTASRCSSRSSTRHSASSTAS